MIQLDVQNPYNFDTIPDTDDLLKWSNAALQKPDAEQKISLVIRFVNEEEGIDLNHKYRDKNSATNVLSFPYEVPDYAADILELNDEYSHLSLGDLVLCEKVVRAEHKTQNKTLLQHWAHLIVHGVLHLQGFDHINDDDAVTMESLEIKILKRLGFDDPYAENPTRNEKTG